MPSRSRRLLAGLLLSLSLVAAAAPSVEAAPARTPRGANYSDDQLAIRDQVNHTRNNNGMPDLVIHKNFSDRALLWARELARCQCLRHRAGPYGAPVGWQAAAENVGRGYSLAQVHGAFLGSPPHRANILTRRMTHIGVGVARDAQGEIFIVHAFADLR